MLTTHPTVTDLLGLLGLGNSMAVRFVLSLAWDTNGLHHADLFFNMENILLAIQICMPKHIFNTSLFNMAKAHDVGSLGQKMRAGILWTEAPSAIVESYQNSFTISVMILANFLASQGGICSC